MSNSIPAILTTKKILIVDDDEQMASALKQDFIEDGYQVSVAKSLGECQDQINITHAIVDLRLSHGELGLDAIDIILSRNPTAKVIVLSGYGSLTAAIESGKKGALQFLTKPASFIEIKAALDGSQIKMNLQSRRSLAEIEHDYIDFMLIQNRGNISQTAKDLGLHRQSLQRKLKKYT